MCGLCGFVTNENYSSSIIVEMVEKISHRGPDDSKTMKIKGSCDYWFGHNRLSIIDLDSRSSQPFVDDSGIILLYNGEIYNYRELREFLTNHDFKTNSDTEVILAGFKHEGIEFIKKLVGIFAIAIFDQQTETTYLVRDRIGVKPLFYFCNNKELVYGSELSSAVCHPGVNATIDRNSLQSLLSLKFIPSPNTIYKEVYKVDPGTIVIFEKNRYSKKIVYWNLIDEFLKKQGKLKKNNSLIITSNVEDEIITSIKRNLISDVEIASLLSSGIDSSLVTSIASKERKLSTFTIGFLDSRFNELDIALEISRELGLENINTKLGFNDLKNLLIKPPFLISEPIVDSSIIPMLQISKMVNSNSYKVMLSGDGGDELFYGYSHYLKYSKYLRGFKMFNKILNLFKISKIIPESIDYKSGFIKYVLGSLSSLRNFIYSLYGGYTAYYANKVVLNSSRKDALESFEIFEQLRKVNSLNLLSLFDLRFYLPDDMLTKVDRASMAYSVESRVPLLDHPLIEKSFGLRIKDHVSGNLLKKIPKNLLKKYLKDDLILKNKKGFNIPIIDLINDNDVMKEVKRLSNYDYIIKQGLFDYSEISKIINKKKKKSDKSYLFIWNYLNFQIWYDKTFYNNF